MKRLLGQADDICVQTPTESNELRSWDIPDSHQFILGMGVDRDEVTGGSAERGKRLWDLPAGHPIIGHLATLDQNKGTIDLIRAIKILNEQRPADQKILLLLAGGSTPAFDQWWNRLGLDGLSWARRLGRIQDCHKPDFYATLDVFAMPSRTDSFGIVYLEAWANRKPVIGARAGGVVDVIDHGETGLLTRFGQVAELAEAISQLLERSSLARRLGDRGFERIEHGSGWEDVYQRWSNRLMPLLGFPAERLTDQGDELNQARAKSRRRLRRDRPGGSHHGLPISVGASSGIPGSSVELRSHTKQ